MRDPTTMLWEAATQVLLQSQLSMVHQPMQHLPMVAMLLELLIASILIQLLQGPLPREQYPMRQSSGAVHLVSLQLPLHPCGLVSHFLPEVLHLLDVQGM
jgi:hypothetical protein